MNSPSNITDKPSLVAVVSLGSNLPNADRTPAQLVRSAMERLRELGMESSASSLYRSEPLDCPPGSEDFINAVMTLRVSAGVSASQMLVATQGIEAEFGRRRGAEPNQARTLDIDIISYGNQVLESDELILPHPRAAQRKFVLLPLAEIDPHMILPGQTASVSQLLAALPESERVWRLS